jgi:hypothetical protein
LCSKSLFIEPITGKIFSSHKEPIGSDKNIFVSGRKNTMFRIRALG